MEILINGQTIDVTLEKEDTLAEIISSVDSWLSGNLVLTSVRVDDKEMFSVPESEWSKINPGQIGSVDMTIRHVQELRITNLQTMEEYLQMLAAALPQGKKESLDELLPGMSYLVESARQHLEPDTVQQFEQLQELVANRGDSAQPIPQVALEMVGQLEHSVHNRLQEWINPKGVLPDLVNELSQSIADISDVSILLQTGKDRPAMEAVIRFSELSQSLIRVFSILELSSFSLGGKPVDTFFDELNGILNDLLQAFDAQDSVLIGDLLEYEIAPRLEKLKTFATSLT